MHAKKGLIEILIITIVKSLVSFILYLLIFLDIIFKNDTTAVLGFLLILSSNAFIINSITEYSKIPSPITFKPLLIASYLVAKIGDLINSIMFIISYNWKHSLSIIFTGFVFIHYFMFLINSKITFNSEIRNQGNINVQNRNKRLHYLYYNYTSLLYLVIINPSFFLVSILYHNSYWYYSFVFVAAEIIGLIIFITWKYKRSKLLIEPMGKAKE